MMQRCVGRLGEMSGGHHDLADLVAHTPVQGIVPFDVTATGGVIVELVRTTATT